MRTRVCDGYWAFWRAAPTDNNVPLHVDRAPYLPKQPAAYLTASSSNSTYCAGNQNAKWPSQRVG